MMKKSKGLKDYVQNIISQIKKRKFLEKEKKLNDSPPPLVEDFLYLYLNI